jgi:hypothetical protein
MSSLLQQKWKVYALGKPVFYQDQLLGGAEWQTHVDWTKEETNLTPEEHQEYTKSGTIAFSQVKHLS